MRFVLLALALIAGPTPAQELLPQLRAVREEYARSLPPPQVILEREPMEMAPLPRIVPAVAPAPRRILPVPAQTAPVSQGVRSVFIKSKDEVIRPVDITQIHTPLSVRDDLPVGAVRYTVAVHTQAIAVTNDRNTIDPVPIKKLPDQHLWGQSGGLYGIKGWRSEKYIVLPAGKTPEEKFEHLRNWNGRSYQRNWGLWVWFPVGTVFIDRLINTETGEVFEDRRREKMYVDNQDTRRGWTSYVYDSNPSARPRGYTGLKVSCASCHDRAGLGLYAEGGAPGTDTVFSYPLPWHLIDKPGGPVQTANLFRIR